MPGQLKDPLQRRQLAVDLAVRVSPLLSSFCSFKMNAFTSAVVIDARRFSPRVRKQVQPNTPFELVRRSGHFEIFLTADRNLSYQQDLSAFDIAIVVLVARSSRLEDLRALVPRLLEVLPTAARRAVTLVQA